MPRLPKKPITLTRRVDEVETLVTAWEAADEADDHPDRPLPPGFEKLQAAGRAAFLAIAKRVEAQL